MPTLGDRVAGWLPGARARLTGAGAGPRLEQIGRLEQLGDGIAMVSGLPATRSNELLRFPGDTMGLATNLYPDSIGCILLGDTTHLSAGQRVHGTGSVVRVPVGESLLGRVLDPLGKQLDGGPPIDAHRLEDIERPAPAIIDRAEVTRALLTGVLTVDAMFPLGRGQRELIIGDRSTGKTALAIDAIINQRRSDVICVYVAIGQKSSSIQQVVEAVRKYGPYARCIFVVAEADAPAGLQWLAPYAGMTMAEYFRDQGRDALIVIDDLTKHAAIHRQLALLLRQPAGREAYPGDVFYIHARLLERAAQLAPEKGGGSLTALPIAETQAGNLSAYIPTNLISITDGQIYLDAKLFYEGQKPPVDVGRSVSRVGGKTQPPALRALAESLRLDYAQFLELEVFTRFGGVLGERTRQAIEHGRRIRALLGQQQYAPHGLGVELALLLALDRKLLDGLELVQVAGLKARLAAELEGRTPEVMAALQQAGKLDSSEQSALLAAITELSAPRIDPVAVG